MFTPFSVNNITTGKYNVLPKSPENPALITRRTHFCPTFPAKVSRDLFPFCVFFSRNFHAFAHVSAKSWTPRANILNFFAGSDKKVRQKVYFLLHRECDAEGAFRASALRLRGGASAGVCKESEGLGPFGGDCRPNTSGGSGGSSKGKAIEVTSPPCARTYTRVALAACLCGYPSLTIRPSRMQSCAVSRCLRVRASTDLCACRCGKTGGSTSRVVLASTTGSARCVPDYVCGHAMPAEHTHRESESVK